MTQTLTRSQIEYLIPHRAPLLLLDAVLAWQAHQTLHAERTFPADDPIFQGHFPGFPVVPGVLQVECLAQAAGVLLNLSTGHTAADSHFLFVSIEDAKFRRTVEPDECLHLHVRQVKHKRGIYWFTGETRVGEDIASTANFSAKHVIDTPGQQPLKALA